MKNLSWIFLLLGSFNVYGQNSSSVRLTKPAADVSSSTQEPVLWGHNLTPTTYTLKKNQVTGGTYVLGYGVSDNFMISTSPWIDLLYNMPSLNLRYLVYEKNDLRFLADGSYLKTLPYFRNVYQQESVYLRAVGSKRFSSLFTLHGSFDYQYFWDETAPFSLDPTPGYGSTTSTSVLGEFHWFKNVGTFIEAGVLGLNYETPYLHLGASVFATFRNALLQVGVSRSSSMGMENVVTSSGYNYWYLSRVLWHPEIQMQVYF